MNIKLNVNNSTKHFLPASQQYGSKKKLRDTIVRNDTILGRDINVGRITF